MDLLEYVKQNEGLRLLPYHCTTGKLTVGYGRNLDDNGISEDEAEVMLRNDLNRAFADVCKVFETTVYGRLSSNRHVVLLDMMFHLGQTRFRKFKKMIAAVKKQDFEEAAKQILDSWYAKQVSTRAIKNAELMRKG